jgi:hypothetical protein
MDFLGAISRIYNLAKILQKKPAPAPGFGFYSQRYDTPQGPAVLYIVLGPPGKRKAKVKSKDFDAIIDKSKSTGRLILPKDYLVLEDYLCSIHDQLVKPREEILRELYLLLAGLRLEFIPNQNLKLTFNDPNNIQIVVYDKEKDGHFGFYINITNLKEEGLYLAHERQLNFIIQEISAGKDPLTIKNLPALRTGETALKQKAAQGAKGANPSIPQNKREMLKQIIKQRADKEAVDKELREETVIESFSPDTNTKENVERGTSSSQTAAETPSAASKPLFQPVGLFGGPRPIKTAPQQGSPSENLQEIRPNNINDPGTINPSMASPETTEKISAQQPEERIQPISPFARPSKVTDRPPKLPFVQSFPGTPSPINIATINNPIPTAPAISPQLVPENITKQLDEQKQENEKLREQIRNLEAQNQALIMRLQTTTDDYAKQLEGKNQEIMQYKQLFSKSDQEKVAYQKLMDEFKAKNEELQKISQQLSQAQDQIKFVSEQNRANQDVILRQQQVIEEISKKNAKLDDMIESLTTEKSKLEEEMKDFGENMSENFTQNLVELEEENAILAKAIEEADKKNEDLELENNELKAHLAAIENELNSLDEDFDLDEEPDKLDEDPKESDID